MPRWAGLAIVLLATWLLTTHFLHVFSEAINWDEFALLDRADRTLRLGEIVGGGRPGLVPIMLMPFVKDCIDSVQTVVSARIMWMFLTLAYLAGVYALVRRWHLHSRRPETGHAQALLAVVLLAFLPAFVTWSVQVRTDQVALAAAVWGGVLLMSTGYLTASIAGVLFGIALLATQKGIYVIGLCSILFATATAARMLAVPSSRRAELIATIARGVLAAATTAIVIAIYTKLFPEVARLASGEAVSSGMETMRWTRERQGYRIYTVHSGRLIVHWVMLGLLIAWTAWVIARRRSRTPRMPVMTSWLVLLLGGAVVTFHGSSFPYFIMTAGLFPAIALSITAGNTLAMAGRMAWPILLALMALAALQSAPETLEMLADTQSEQQETLQLVYNSNLRNRRGYQVEGALFCAKDPDPIRTMFSQGIARHFRMSPQAAEHTAEFIDEFRRRPVAYIVESYRLQQFPADVNRFFANHYVWYGKSLYVAGFRLNFSEHGARDVEVIVPGTYRWTPDSSSPQTSLLVNGQALAPSGEIELAAGHHAVTSREPMTLGSLMLADVPAREREGYPSFYHQRQVLQLGGRR